LGMHAVWISEAQAQPLPPRVHRIAHIKELPGVLETLEQHYSGGVYSH
jgi:putative hydrolase of the HAD superfamily